MKAPTFMHDVAGVLGRGETCRGIVGRTEFDDSNSAAGKLVQKRRMQRSRSRMP